MCGIAGFIGSLANKMDFRNKCRSDILPRGPDGYSSISIGNGGFISMSTLAVFNPLAEHGPYYSNSRKHIITYNGEIYNTDYLMSKYKIKIDDQSSDAKLLVELYELLGDNFLAEVNGMFAFGIYDVENQSIIIGVDRFSQKSLFYIHTQSGLAFCSVYTSLQLFASNQCEISNDFWIFEDYVKGRTPSKNIKRLNGGDVLKYSVKSKKLTTIQYTKTLAFDRNFNLDDALLDISKQYKPTCNTAILLSGGLDSSILASLLKPDVAITISSKEHSAYDEEEKAKQVCKKFGIEHVVITPTKDDLHNYISDLKCRLQYPIGNGSAFPEYLAYKKISAMGIRVCYSGIGADELFLGYERMRIFISHFLKRKHLRTNNYSFLESYFRKVIDPKLSIDQNYLRFIARDSGKLNNYLASSENLSIGDIMTKIELEYILPGLLRTTDALSGSFGIECRSPFLDEAIYGLSTKLEDELKISKDGVTKVFLRNFATKVGVPDSIIFDETKRGFSAPYGIWLGSEKKERGLFDRTRYVKSLVQCA